jgi:predicted nucleic acid-binding protein
VRTYLDASALAGRYIRERNTGRVEEILRDCTSLGTSVLSIPEILSGLCRRRREGFLSSQIYQQAKDALMEDVADASIVPVSPEVLKRATELLEEAHELSAVDALHVGSALEWGAQLFVSADARQLAAASRFGLSTSRV